MATYKFYYDVSQKAPRAATPKVEKNLSHEIKATSDEEAVEKARDLVRIFQDNPPDSSNTYEFKLTKVFKEIWSRLI